MGTWKNLGKVQEGCVKVQDGWPPTTHCPSWLKGHETEISPAGLDLKGLVPSYLLHGMLCSEIDFSYEKFHLTLVFAFENRTPSDLFFQRFVNGKFSLFQDFLFQL